jgi:hypothetical protein
MEPQLYQLHLDAGLRCGRARTCGTKQPYESELDAERAAAAHNRWKERRHDVEPYPCAFCEKWHVGRVMAMEELEGLIAKLPRPDFDGMATQ